MKTRIRLTAFFSKKRKYLTFNIVIFFMASLLGFGMLEVAARILWRVEFNKRLELLLHGFDHIDRRRMMVVPTAGISKTVHELSENLKAQNKKIGLKLLQRCVEEYNLSDDFKIFQINSHGFKGPEFDIPKPNSVFRILAIGDSCTWGPNYDMLNYPRIMESELRRRKGNGKKIEVVNAGVLGFNLESVLKRMDEYLKVEPDLVTFYIGWNRTIHRADPKKNRFLYRHSAFYKLFYHGLVNRSGLSGPKSEHIGKGTYFDKNEPLITMLRRHDFSYDIKDLSQIIRTFKREYPDCRFAVITLAGLFDERVEPDKEALNKAYRTAFTNNLFSWVVLVRKYNEELRAFCSGRDILLIDFEAWALENFIPRSEHYVDPVHLSNQAYEKMGKFFAEEILSRIMQNYSTLNTSDYKEYSGSLTSAV